MVLERNGEKKAKKSLYSSRSQKKKLHSRYTCILQAKITRKKLWLNSALVFDMLLVIPLGKGHP
jgi:hypothetical protein